MHITIDGARYKVLENLRYQHSAGVYAKAVITPTGERIATKPPGGAWRFHVQRVLPPDPRGDMYDSPTT